MELDYLLGLGLGARKFYVKIFYKMLYCYPDTTYCLDPILLQVMTNTLSSGLVYFVYKSSSIIF
jgi:hypothetical protein